MTNEDRVPGGFTFPAIRPVRMFALFENGRIRRLYVFVGQPGT
ncbi:hypothetical protein [Pseudorhizobium marinum]|nr:hypothetical protein [Pseudorhizobium marinum]